MFFGFNFASDRVEHYKAIDFFCLAYDTPHIKLHQLNNS